MGIKRTSLRTIINHIFLCVVCLATYNSADAQRTIKLSPYVGFKNTFCRNTIRPADESFRTNRYSPEFEFGIWVEAPLKEFFIIVGIIRAEATYTYFTSLRTKDYGLSSESLAGEYYGQINGGLGVYLKKKKASQYYEQDPKILNSTITLSVGGGLNIFNFSNQDLNNGIFLPVLRTPDGAQISFEKDTSILVNNWGGSLWAKLSFNLLVGKKDRAEISLCYNQGLTTLFTAEIEYSKTFNFINTTFYKAFFKARGTSLSFNISYPFRVGKKKKPI